MKVMPFTQGCSVEKVLSQFKEVCIFSGRLVTFSAYLYHLYHSVGTNFILFVYRYLVFVKCYLRVLL